MDILAEFPVLLRAGWLNLLDYLAAHVLLCLLPAFLIAGYLSAMIPQQAITRYLGPRSKPWVSYPAATLGGFILAVCSCTILPLFAGIWKRGAGLGPAIAFLFVGPAVNILAISYTGAAIGMQVALARIVLSILFGITIGVVMARLFRSAEQARARAMSSAGPFDQTARIDPAVLAVFGLLLAVLLAGTLQVEPLDRAWTGLRLDVDLPDQLMQAIEGLELAPQGALLILLLALLAPLAYLGFERVLDRFSRWTYAALSLTALTLLSAAPHVTAGSLTIGLTGRFFVELILLVSVALVAWRRFERDQIAEWLWESWRFVKQIFPLLLIGVFLAGALRAIVPPELIQSLAGENSLPANAIAAVFGVFMYFPTLVEVPVARAFLDLGMHPGPLLAYLLADPELSIQSILVTAGILGRRRTLAYVGLVAVFCTLAGYLYGAFLAIQ